MKKWTTLAVLMAAAAFVGCEKSDAPQGDTVTPGKKTMVTITLINAGETKAPTGSEEGESHENTLKTLELYVFDAAGNPDKKLGASVAGDDGNGYHKVTDTNKAQNVIVSSGTGKTFVAVANMDVGPLAGGEKYADLKAKLASSQFKATAGGADHNSRDTRTTTGFEMLGEKTGVEIKEGVINQKVTITADRLVSKLVVPTFKNGTDPAGVILTDEDVETVWGENSGITPAMISFQFDGYAVINGITKSHIYFIGNANGDDTTVPWSVDWLVWSAGKDYLVSKFDSNGFYTNNYSGYGSSDWFLAKDNDEAIYFYENKPGEIEEDGQVGYNPKNVYALMLKGTLKVAGKPEKDAVRYWRLDLTRDDDYHILRNCVYRVNVKNITSPGFGTPQEAEDDNKIIPGKDKSAADITILVNKWRVNLYEYEI